MFSLFERPHTFVFNYRSCRSSMNAGHLYALFIFSLSPLFMLSFRFSAVVQVQPICNGNVRLVGLYIHAAGLPFPSP